MQESRVLADNLQKERLKLPLDNQLFDFVSKLRVGDKKNMDVIIKLVNERKTDEGETVFRIKLIDAKLSKLARLE